MITLDTVTHFNNDAPVIKEKSTEKNHSPTPNKKSDTSLSIDAILGEIAQWRTQKTHFNEPIPDRLWEEIFCLAKTYGANRIRRLLSISSEQYKRKYQLLHPHEYVAPKKPPENLSAHAPEFCEAKIQNPIFEPLQIPTNTVIAEFVRADGHVMKIHCLSNRFEELIQAFFQGKNHDPNHP